jgi:hypothetical protein
MLIKVISELVIVFCIVLAIMGIPTQTITKTVKEPVKETHCWCGGIPESLKNLNAKYHLSTYDIDQIDANFYAPKMIEYQEKTTIITQWIDRLLIVAIYLALIGIISAIVSSNSSSYWYYILPIVETIIFIFLFPKNHKQKKIEAMTDINDRVSRILPNVISNLNNHLKRN